MTEDPKMQALDDIVKMLEEKKAELMMGGKGAKPEAVSVDVESSGKPEGLGEKVPGVADSHEPVAADDASDDDSASPDEEDATDGQGSTLLQLALRAARAHTKKG